MAEYNLIYEPWIPCIDLDGKQVERGIRDTLLQAHKICEIFDDSPLVTLALHRMLLAILYRAYRGPKRMADWESVFKRGCFNPDSGIDNYLNKWRNHFFLFDDTHPFMQVAGLDLNDYDVDGKIKKDKSDGLMRLVREAPDKGGRILFDHRIGAERLTYEYKQIARMILSAQCYSGTGVASAGKINGRTISPSPCQFAPCVDGLILWIQGENVFQTLMFNLVPRNYISMDKPAWEDDSIVNTAIYSWQTPNGFSGPVQRFALLSRFILVRDKKSMFFTNGLKVAPDTDDPMKAYLRSDDRSEYKSIKLHPDKAVWRDAHTLFSLNSSIRKTPESMNHLTRIIGNREYSTMKHPKVNIVGLATDQGKALLWRHERMPVPSSLLADPILNERLGGLIQESEQVAKEIRNRAYRIAKLYLAPDAESSGVRQPDREDVGKVAAAIDPRPAYWVRLENHFFTLLENLPDDRDPARSSWKPDDQQTATNAWRLHIKFEARQALEESIRSLGTTARAIQAVARVRTDFNDDDLKPKPQKAVKAKRDLKGGKKK